MSVLAVNYMRVEGEPEFTDFSTVTTTTGTDGGWRYVIGVDPAGGTGYLIPYPLQDEILELVHGKNKIKKALGYTHYVKNNKLFRR